MTPLNDITTDSFYIITLWKILDLLLTIISDNKGVFIEQLFSWFYYGLYEIYVCM